MSIGMLRGDPEKLATTDVDDVLVNGVRISSRYGKADELELMFVVMLRLPPHVLAAMSEVFCDSKACCAFAIELRSASDPATEMEVVRFWHALLMEIHGGHNGIDCGNASAEPDWNEGEVE